ncbi:MAG TPA: tetratricopeptide repeat protein [Myxococcales bacterium]|nr:tetratricopeptide repeat protein [Myxococcales bacterium]
MPARIEAPVELSIWFKELKRRRVFRTLVAYAIAAFAILQVIEPVMHGLALPEWLLKAVVIGLGLGLPVTLLLAWAYDISPQGIERTPSPAGASVKPTARAYRALVLVALGLLLASPVVIYYLVRGDHRTAVANAAGSPNAASVAVLPFVNMSGDPSNEYFSDGLSEEILNALAGIPGLQVPARTSSFAFKGQSQDVAKIGAALRVANVLEGSVRKAGDRVRITAQLVSASDGYHLWSRTYERSLSDVFAIEDEISADIANALKVKLVPPDRALATQPAPTTNPEAYEAYLLGRHWLNERNVTSMESAIASFRKATALAPDFAAAYADLAIATLFLGRSDSTYGDVPMHEAIANARVALDKAVALAPDHFEVLAAVGLAESFEGHFQRALELYDRSLAANPSNGEVRNWKAMALENLGRYDQALTAASEAVKVDPLSKIALYNYAPTLQAFGRTAEIPGVVDRLRALDEGWGEWTLGTLAQGRGDRPEAVRHYLRAVRLGRDKARLALAEVFAELGLREEALRVAGTENVRVLWALGDRAAALQAARNAAERAPDIPEAKRRLFMTVYGSGRTAEAAALAAALWKQGEPAVGMKPELLLMMADAARTGGNKNDAARYRERAQDGIELARRSGVTAEHVDLARAAVAAYDGRDQEAVALLVANLPSFSGSRTDLELPITRRLSLRPDFQSALHTLDATLTEQRQQVRRMLCGPDRVSASWQPAPETCTHLTMAP